MKGGKREVAKHTVEFRLYNPTEAMLLNWLKEERGGSINMNASIMDVLRLAHFLLTYQPNIVVNINNGFSTDSISAPNELFQNQNQNSSNSEDLNDPEKVDPEIMQGISLDDGIVSSENIDDDDDYYDPFSEE